MNHTTPLEFWYEFGSNYSYLSVMRIEAVAASRGVTLLWRPFLLGPIFKSLGWATSPFVLQKRKGAYVWQDMERQCRKYALPWKKPSVFPRQSLLPTRVAVVGTDQPWIGEFSRRIMAMNFAHDVDVGNETAVRTALDALADADTILRQAGDESTKRALGERTDEAGKRGAFGAPTFFAGQEMFWGNDRLEDAIAFASSPQQQ